MKFLSFFMLAFVCLTEASLRGNNDGRALQEGHEPPQPGDTLTLTRSDPTEALDNQAPHLSVNYIISTTGVFPSYGGDQASGPMLGEIRMFAGNYAPAGWALCDGQLIAINSNTALFSILGTNYGGDGRTTFGLPDMRGRYPVHPNPTTNHHLGYSGGVQMQFLKGSNMPQESRYVLENVVRNAI